MWLKLTDSHAPSHRLERVALASALPAGFASPAQACCIEDKSCSQRCRCCQVDTQHNTGHQCSTHATVHLNC